MSDHKAKRNSSTKREATLSTPSIFWDHVTQFRGKWYEGCHFVPIPSDKPYPDYLFRVEFQDAGTRETKTRTSIVLTADQRVWDYIESHPYWRIDPRPLFLDTIRDVLWQQKLVVACFEKPTTIRTGVKFLQGGTIYMVLTAEVLVETGGNTILHLANWANQHIPDQLAAVFEQRPEARPPKSHCDAVLADFKVGVDARELALRDKQKAGLNARGTNPRALSAFIDESGDLGFKTLAFSYVLTATIFPDAEVASVRREVAKLVNDTWAKQSKPSEIHFNKLSGAKREAIVTGLSAIFAAHDGQFVLLDCRKDNFLAYLLRCEAEYRHSEERPIITQWPDVLNDPDGQANRTLLVLSLEEMVCHLASELLDSGGKLSITHDKKYREWMNRALEYGYERSKDSMAILSQRRYGQDVALPLTFRLEHSQNEPCLWFSDWIAWETARWFRSEDASQGFEACVPRMTFISFNDSGKKLHGNRLGDVAAGELPDIPRDIQALVLPTKQVVGDALS